MARFWYSYVLPSADPRLSSSYQRINDTPRCTIGTRLCAIYSPSGGLAPFSPISLNLQTYIAAALVNGVPQPENPLGAKYYVYLKP